MVKAILFFAFFAASAVFSVFAQTPAPVEWRSYAGDLRNHHYSPLAQVNAANDYGVTPLSLACSVGGSPLAQKLLEAGANPNSTQISGETALMTCSRTNALDAMEALLARGPEIAAGAVRQASGDHAQPRVPGNSETGWPAIGPRR